MRFFRNDGLWPVDAGINDWVQEFVSRKFVPTQAWRVFGAIFVFPSDMEDEASVAAGCAHQGSALVSQRCDNDRFGNLMSFSNEESRSTSEVDAMNDIVRRAFVAGHGLVLSLGFGDCRTSFGAFNLTQSFERLLLACDIIRIDIRADLKRRHIELLKDVGKALRKSAKAIGEMMEEVGANAKQPALEDLGSTIKSKAKKMKGAKAEPKKKDESAVQYSI